MIAMQVDLETWKFGTIQCSFVKFASINFFLFFLSILVLSCPNFGYCFHMKVFSHCHLAQIYALQVPTFKSKEIWLPQQNKSSFKNY
jgi:hypothetical protein